MHPFRGEDIIGNAILPQSKSNMLNEYAFNKKVSSYESNYQHIYVITYAILLSLHLSQALLQIQSRLSENHLN